MLVLRSALKLKPHGFGSLDGRRVAVGHLPFRV